MAIGAGGLAMTTGASIITRWFDARRGLAFGIAGGAMSAGQPPTTTLTANIFGRYSVGELSGWIFFAHQVGAALGAAIAGWMFEWTGSYSPAFVSAAVLAIIAAGLALAIRDEPVRARPLAPVPAIAG